MRIFYPRCKVTLSFVPYDRSGLEELLTVTDQIPIEAEVESTPIKMADKFKVTLPRSLFPGDPRLFRAVAVAVYMGNVRGVDAGLDSNASNLLLLGHADDLKKGYDSSSQHVTLTGRDYKGILLDEVWQGRSVARGRRLSVMLDELLRTLPAAAGITVELEDEAFDPVVPAPARGRKRRAYRASTNTPLFQGMFDLALSVGASVTVRGDKLVIGRPRTFDANSDEVPFFVAAENLTRLEVAKKFGTSSLPNVRITCYDRENGRTLTGQYPEKLRGEVKVSGSGSKKTRTVQNTIHSFTVALEQPTVAALNTIARNVFDSFAQQQCSISFETRDLTVPVFFQDRRLQGDETRMDLTQIRNGSPVRILFSEAARDILNKPISQEQKQRELVQRGLAAAVARVLARGFTDFDNTFFVDSITHKYSGSNGISASGKASAFVTVDLEGVR